MSTLEDLVVGHLGLLVQVGNVLKARRVVREFFIEGEVIEEVIADLPDFDVLKAVE